jgi:hypothetical protein
MSEDDYGYNYFTEYEYEEEINKYELRGREQEEQEEQEDAEKKVLAQRYKKKKSTAIKLIAGLNNKEQIQNKIIKKLFHDELDYMINRYAKKESLPIEYIKIAQQQNCLEILIKGFLKKDGEYVLTSEIIDEINSFIEIIYMNDDLEIVYQRVAKIQKFIHGKIDAKHGQDAHLNITVKHIRNLLSACRLHLNLYDFKYKDINSLIYIIDKSKEASDAEMINPTKVVIPKGKKYIKNWRVRHMKTLFYFTPIEKKINKILHLKTDTSINQFKALILHIYSLEDTRRFNKDE